MVYGELHQFHWRPGRWRCCSAGDGNFSSSSSRLAEAAAVVVTNESHKGRVYELAGDEAFTLVDLAKEISKQTGRDIPYKNLPEAEYCKVLEGFGIPAQFAAAIASWDVAASKGDLFDDSRQLSTLIGRGTTPLSESVKAAL